MNPFFWRCCSVATVVALLASCGSPQVGSRFVKAVDVTASSGAVISVSDKESAELAGTALAIPAGALAANTRITVTLQHEAILPDITEAAGPVAVWGPSGTTFAAGTTLTLPYQLAAGQSTDDLFVYVLEENGQGRYIFPPALSIDAAHQTGTFPVSGFTRFQHGRRHCRSGEVKCAGVCTNLATDARNCGACGVACQAGQSCTNGACGRSTPDGGGCASGETLCTDPRGAQVCTNLSTDPGNCGACGAVCGANQTCIRGFCNSAGDGGCAPTTCAAQGWVCGGLSDGCGTTLNCGSCGAGQTCNSGQCVGTVTDAGACAAGETLCRDPRGALVCANLTTDPNNCGACGAVCGANQTCIRGFCSTVVRDAGCAPTSCGAQGWVCGSLSNGCGTTLNCGSCGAGQTCNTGQCVAVTDAGSCAAGETLCRDPRGGLVCANLATDPNNCGACGAVCTAAQSCVRGTCL